MKFILVTLLFFYAVPFATAQSNQELLQEIERYQQKLNDTYTNPETTILLRKDFKRFKGLEFYPADLKYRVEAVFVRTPDEKPFLMPTTTDRLPEYVKYGEFHFQIDSLEFVLDVFQNTSPSPGYETSLFLPFTDITSGNGSYGGGRYLDMEMPEGNRAIIDFNKAYNPYCAYNPGYSCPIPPEQNDMQTRIEAGVKDFLKK
ncbi:MAG: DUF1684 domain-containing protein [Flavobacteriaceae bacterium]